MAGLPPISLSLIALKMGLSVRLNGFDVLAHTGPRAAAARIDCRPFMFAGENRLVAWAEVLPDDDTLGEPSAEVSLVVGDLASDKNTNDILAQTEVSPAITKLLPDAPTIVLAHAFHIEADGSPWAFMRAEPIDRSVEGDTLALVRSVRDAIGSRNVKQLVSTFASVISETAQATELSRAAVEDAFVAHWTDVVTEDDVHVRETPLHPILTAL